MVEFESTVVKESLFKQIKKIVIASVKNKGKN